MTDKPVKSAFPHDNLERGMYHITAEPGMTLRDYFAAKVIAILMVSITKSSSDDELAARAYQMADAMMKARDQ